MYYQYFGLTEAPFSIAVNPRYLFMSPRHRDALAHLLYGVGAGGGFISVPFMLWCNVPLHQAVATSAALGFPIALANTIGYVWSGWGQTGLPPTMVGYIFWPALIVLAIFSVVLAPIGARAAHKLPVKTLKRIFAYLLFGLAIYMGFKAYLSFFG